ncbi:MAG TPA: hypothetical protein ENH85_07655 [Candidatus Scalindua sp.]|nr:hypothetical protein [Candidatus Scalindua sp.]
MAKIKDQPPYVEPKETMKVHPKNLGKQEVGKKKTVTITGMVVEQGIDRWDKNKKFYRMEIDNIKDVTKKSLPKSKRGTPKSTGRSPGGPPRPRGRR